MPRMDTDTMYARNLTPVSPTSTSCLRSVLIVFLIAENVADHLMASNPCKNAYENALQSESHRTVHVYRRLEGAPESPLSPLLVPPRFTSPALEMHWPEHAGHAPTAATGSPMANMSGSSDASHCAPPDAWIHFNQTDAWPD